MSLPQELRLACLDDLALLIRLNDREVDRDILVALAEGGFPSGLGLRPTGELLGGPHELLREAMMSLRDPAPQTLDALAADFAAIYLTGALGASPCESVWVDKDRLMCQAPMFELRRLYEAAGLANPDWRKRPDDHAVMQMDYLHRRMERDAGEAELPRQLAQFLDGHLLRWFPEFAARAAGRCDTPFYAGVVTLTAAWLETFRDALASLLGTPRPTVRGLGLADGQGGAPEQAVSFVPGAAPSW